MGVDSGGRARWARLLGVFAHPDDETFCAGGTFARPRSAHVVAAEGLTCLVFSPEAPTRYGGRGEGALLTSPGPDFLLRELFGREYFIQVLPPRRVETDLL